MLYEGGIRVPGFVHSPNFVKNPGRVHDKLVHITDWVPTILRLATGQFIWVWTPNSKFQKLNFGLLLFYFNPQTVQFK